MREDFPEKLYPKNWGNELKAGFFEIGSVRTSVLPSVRVFLGIGSLDFPEFRHGARNPYEVVCDTTGLFERLFLPQKLGKWAKYTKNRDF